MGNEPLRSTDAEIDALHEWCVRLNSFGVNLSVGYVDGWLAALACLAADLERSEWLPLLTDDGFGRAYGDPDAAAPALAALDARRRVLADQLRPEALDAEPDLARVDPLMSEWDDRARAEEVALGHIDAETAQQVLQTGFDWADGFCAATESLGGWSPDRLNDAERERYHQLLGPIQALLLAPEALAHYVSDLYPGRTMGRDALIDEACFAVQDLRLFWLEHAVRTTPRRAEPRPGRNDPCPCGSGKKYKKCHGA